ncbi:MAG: class I SAM-dependent methyltransferase [bacterium]|nr:class I SAM-dependent methyltransferase [bacterium]
MKLVASVMDLCERGIIPDPVIRWGIRQIIRRGLNAEQIENVAQHNARFRQFLRSLDDQPLCVNEVQKENWQAKQLPVDFFQKLLGRHLKFSACFWPVGVHDLDSSEAEAMALICQRAGLQDGMTVLDIGSGWGSLALWIAEHYPNCKVVALSALQLNCDYIEAEGRKYQFENLQTVCGGIDSYHPEGLYDRVFAIEAFMHTVNYRGILNRISNWLTDDGKLFVELFCHRERAYYLGEDSPRNWMGRYFITAGIMPSDDMLLYFQEDLVLEEHWSLNGLHYSQTADCWLENLDRRRNEVMPIMREKYKKEADRWFHKWRLFCITLSELFAIREGNEWWVSQYLMKKR